MTSEFWNGGRDVPFCQDQSIDRSKFPSRHWSSAWTVAAAQQHRPGCNSRHVPGYVSVSTWSFKFRLCPIDGSVTNETIPLSIAPPAHRRRRVNHRGGVTRVLGSFSSPVQKWAKLTVRNSQHWSELVYFSSVQSRRCEQALSCTVSVTHMWHGTSYSRGAHKPMQVVD